MTHSRLLPSFLFFFFFLFFLLSQLPLLPALPFSSAATIPAIPDQQSASSSPSSSSSASSACPLHPRDDLLPAVSTACSSPSSSSSSHLRHRRSFCCPALAAWLLAAYAPTALSAPPPSKWPRDFPTLPEDAEACGAAADRALRVRGVELPQQAENGTCPDGGGGGGGGAAACCCGIRLRRLTCSGGGSAAAEEGRWAPPRTAARRLERDCARPGLAGCSHCLRALNQLKSGADTGSGSGSKQDCQLMGLTWLLTRKNGSLYLPAATSVLRVLLAADTAAETDDPTTCSVFHVDSAMPLAVDSAVIDGRDLASGGASLAVQYLTLLLPLILILLSTLSF